MHEPLLPRSCLRRWVFGSLSPFLSQWWPNRTDLLQGNNSDLLLIGNECAEETSLLPFSVGGRGLQPFSAEFGVSVRKEAGFHIALPSPREASCHVVEGLLFCLGREGERDQEAFECFGCKSSGGSGCFILDSILTMFP